nr:unnamed protein product [Callosobruchus chinensis]
MKYPYYKNQIDTNPAARQDVLMPSVRRDVVQRHIRYTGPKIYNALPSEFRTTAEYKQLKSETKSCLRLGIDDEKKDVQKLTFENDLNQ